MRRGLRALAAVALAFAACKRAAPPTSSVVTPARRIVVPLTPSPITIDGESTEDAWHHAARTGGFVDDAGAPMRPFTEAMFLRDASTLYVHLYAADDDIRSPKVGADGPVWLCDRFRVSFHGGGADRNIDVTPRGEIADSLGNDRSWQSGAHAAADTDGTIDDPRDDDEEWVIEMAVPLTSVGPLAADGSVPVTVERDDVGGKGPRRRSLRLAATLVLR